MGRLRRFSLLLCSLFPCVCALLLAARAEAQPQLARLGVRWEERFSGAANPSHLLGAQPLSGLSSQASIRQFELDRLYENRQLYQTLSMGEALEYQKSNRRLAWWYFRNSVRREARRSLLGEPKSARPATLADTPYSLDVVNDEDVGPDRERSSDLWALVDGVTEFVETMAHDGLEWQTFPGLVRFRLVPKNSQIYSELVPPGTEKNRAPAWRLAASIYPVPPPPLSHGWQPRDEKVLLTGERRFGTSGLSGEMRYYVLRQSMEWVVTQAVAGPLVAKLQHSTALDDAVKAPELAAGFSLSTVF